LSYKTIWDFALTLVVKSLIFILLIIVARSPYFYVTGLVGDEVASFENEGPNPEY
jgi:hypothetical protein